MDPRLVLIEWVDSHYRPGWTTDAPDDTHLLRCRSVGWLVHEDDDVKVLSANVTDEEDVQRCGDMTIPAAAITNIREL